MKNKKSGDIVAFLPNFTPLEMGAADQDGASNLDLLSLKVNAKLFL